MDPKLISKTSCSLALRMPLQLLFLEILCHLNRRVTTVCFYMRPQKNSHIEKMTLISNKAGHLQQHRGSGAVSQMAAQGLRTPLHQSGEPGLQKSPELSANGGWLASW